MKAFWLACALALSTAAAAQTPPAAPIFPTHVPLDKKELEIWKHELILGRLDPIRENIVHLDETKLEMRRAECGLAIGHDGFCDCLNEFLPIKLTLGDYVKFVTSYQVVGKSADGKTDYKFDNEFLQLTAEEERAAFAAQHTCIATSFALKRP